MSCSRWTWVPNESSSVEHMQLSTVDLKTDSIWRSSTRFHDSKSFFVLALLVRSTSK